jgi:hypothetical protein
VIARLARRMVVKLWTESMVVVRRVNIKANEFTVAMLLPQ